MTRMATRWRVWGMLLPWAAACSGDSVQTVTNDQGDPTADQDTTAPVIEHTPITDSQPYLRDVAMSATVTDEDSGVFVVQVVYKRVDSTVWNEASLALADPETGLYEGAIPGEDVQSSGMDYYIFAVDLSNNEATAPEDGAQDPYHFRIDGDVDTGA